MLAWLMGCHMLGGMDKARIFSSCCMLALALALGFLGWEVRQSRLTMERAAEEMKSASRQAAEKARSMAAGAGQVRDVAEKLQSASESVRKILGED